MTDPMAGERKRGREERKPVSWPDGQKEPLDAIVSDWSRELNQRVDNPGTPNPKRGRRERDAYAGWTH